MPEDGGLDRRGLMLAGAALALLPRRSCAASPAESFPLWPGPAPGAPGRKIEDVSVLRSPNGSSDDIAWTHVATPTLTVTRPTRPNGAAVLLVPGGGYARVALRRGGSEIAAMFAQRGFTAFDLLYRLPHDGWAAGPDAPLHDAQRAMRLIRARAAAFDVDPARVAALGFSAGGHVAARLGSRSSATTYDRVDRADALPARPLLLGLYFPVVTLLGAAAHRQSRDELLGANADEARARAFSADQAVGDMPPTYVACAADDPVVDPANSLSLFSALRAAHVPAELMVFEKGGHGFPPADAEGRPYPWLDLFLRFAARHGLSPLEP